MPGLGMWLLSLNSMWEKTSQQETESKREKPAAECWQNAREGLAHSKVGGLQKEPPSQREE